MIIRIIEHSGITVNETVGVSINPAIQFTKTHDPVTVDNSGSVELSLNGQEIKADLKSSYPQATTPLSPNDKLPVRQGGVWKEVDKSELGQAFAIQKAGIVDSSTTLIKNTYTRVTFNTVETDNNSLVVPGKTGIKIKEAGYYIIVGLATIKKLEDGKKMVVRLRINGVAKHLLGRGTSGADDLAGFGGAVMVNLNTDDIIELWIYHNNSVDTDLDGNDFGYNYLQVFKIDN